jgi:hypothetical protein
MELNSLIYVSCTAGINRCATSLLASLLRWRTFVQAGFEVYPPNFQSSSWDYRYEPLCLAFLEFISYIICISEHSGFIAVTNALFLKVREHDFPRSPILLFIFKFT